MNIIMSRSHRAAAHAANMKLIGLFSHLFSELISTFTVAEHLRDQEAACLCKYMDQVEVSKHISLM